MSFRHTMTLDLRKTITNIMKHFLIILCSLVLCTLSYSQNTIQAKRSDNNIVIDGIFDEPAWKTVEAVSDFTRYRPTPGEAAQQTEIKILYDDQAFYMAAFMEEVSRDSIMTQLTERDDIGNTDFVGIIMDTYGAGTGGFEFILCATGVQFDARLSAYNEDTNWDAIWYSEVRLTDKGWFAEIKIPYAAIRFPNKDVQDWNINFIRKRTVSGSNSCWNAIDLSNDNPFLTNIGKLEGIKDIKPPLRLSISPYASLYVEHSHDQNRDPINSTAYSYNGGLDLKYGINDAFTLDMTLIPDFGQVQSDDQVVNLSPFEIRFDEQRQFFTEGTELFNKADLFYSRRVGGRPIGMYNVFDNVSDNEKIIENPNSSQLYNASKVSGRTSNGLGVGVFNAVSAETMATIENIETGEQREFVTAPITNYNIFVIDKNLKNNSSVSFSNSNVWRVGDDYHDANVSAATFNFKTPKQGWGLSGVGKLSQILNPEEDNITGHTTEINFEKLAGTYTFNLWYEETSKNYRQNDLGFLRNGNFRNLGLSLAYRKFEPMFVFNQFQSWFNASYQRLYDPNKSIGTWFNAGFWAQGKNFWNYNMWTNFSPGQNDYFEPRVEGRFSKYLKTGNIGFWVGSDYRKAFRLESMAFFRKVAQEGRHSFEFALGPRYRFNDRFTLGASIRHENSYNDEGFVTQLNNGDIIYGRRDISIFNNVISASYNFDATKSLDLRARHYWSKVNYQSFHTLMDDGYLGDSSYSDFYDFSFNSMTVDMVYRWRFSPGSDLFFVWKNNIIGASSDPNIDYSSHSYRDGIGNLGDLQQNNSFSLRVVYFLDYNGIRNIL